MRIVGADPVDPARREALERAVVAHRITEHVIVGLDALDATFETLVEQDEFTIDLVVRLSDGLFLVYDTT